MRIPEDSMNVRAAEINIVPLIDIIFSILVFFVVASLVLTRSESLDLEPPEASSAQQKRQPDVTISITKDNVIAVNQEPIETLANLIPAVEQVFAEEGTPEGGKHFVLISADQDLTHGRVVQVMDTLSQLPDVTLGFLARRPGTDE